MNDLQVNEKLVRAVQLLAEAIDEMYTLLVQHIQVSEIPAMDKIEEAAAIGKELGILGGVPDAEESG